MSPRRALRVMTVISAIRGRPPAMHQGALVAAAARVATMAVTPGTATAAETAETETAETMGVAMEMAVVAATDTAVPPSRNAPPASARWVWLPREHGSGGTESLLLGMRRLGGFPARRIPSASRRSQNVSPDAAPAQVWSRAAFRNSQADTSHSAAKNPVRDTIAAGQFAPVEPDPAIRATTPTNA
jgi:hypothetical protein